MRHLKYFALSLVLISSGLVTAATVASEPGATRSVAAPSPHDNVALEGFVAVNGVRLQYLDWQGTGPALILIHGLGDNPHIFDDLAPALTSRFHVIAYARRGSGGSDVQGPYDTDNLVRDLLGLMNALRIQKASLVGASAGGDEITAMAGGHPERVERIIYLDGGYDPADPDFKPLAQALPVLYFDPPANAMTSLEAFRAYQKTMMYPTLDDIRRVDANLRERVVIQSDGTLQYRIPKEVIGAMYSALWTNKPRDYSRVQCPALAIFATNLYDMHMPDPKWRAELQAYEEKYWQPFQAKSIARVHQELPGVKIVHVPGSHGSFFLTDRQEVVSLMQNFLSQPQSTHLTRR